MSKPADGVHKQERGHVGQGRAPTRAFFSAAAVGMDWGSRAWMFLPVGSTPGLRMGSPPGPGSVYLPSRACGGAEVVPGQQERCNGQSQPGSCMRRCSRRRPPQCVAAPGYKSGAIDLPHALHSFAALRPDTSRGGGAPSALAHLAQRAQLVVAHHLVQAELQVVEQGDQLQAVGGGKLRQRKGGRRRAVSCGSKWVPAG